MESVPRVVLRWTSPRRVLTVMGCGLTVLTFARIIVLIVESYSAVWSERNADRDLIRMCDAGTASMSTDFRALCMKKRAEQSAPVLLKAVLRACATAFADFCESMSSPTKVVLLLLFCLTGVAAPVVKGTATLFVDHLRRRKRRSVRCKAHDSDDEGSSDDDNETGHHEIVVVTPGASMNGAGRARSACACDAPFAACNAAACPLVVPRRTARPSPSATSPRRRRRATGAAVGR